MSNILTIGRQTIEIDCEIKTHLCPDCAFNLWCRILCQKIKIYRQYKQYEEADKLRMELREWDVKISIEKDGEVKFFHSGIRGRDNPIAKKWLKTHLNN